MSARLTAIEIATRALRRIGEIAPNDEPGGAVAARALEELDTVIADALADRRCWWFVRTGIQLPLQPAQPSYAVDEADGERVLGLQDCRIRSPAQLSRRIGIVPLRFLESVDRPERTGLPEIAAATHTKENLLLSFWPIPDTGYEAELTVSVEAPDVSSPPGAEQTALRPSWQGWAIEACAARIAAGPVRFLPLNEQALLERRAAARLADLLNFDNRPPRTSRRQTRRYFDE